MSAGNSVSVVPSHGHGKLTPWAKGQSGNPSGISPERRALLDAIEKNEVPKVLGMLAALYERGIGGDNFAAKEWLAQVRGPVKPRGDEQLEAAIELKLMELIDEARRRRESPP